jgi:cell division protein FtsQ
VAVALAVLTALLGLLYLAARETPLFAVRTIDVEGAPPAVRDAVLEAAQGWEGESLVALDGEKLLRRLEALPEVRSLRYDRAFPHTLALTVVPEQPRAVVRVRRQDWLVSERGRVIRALGRDSARRWPRIWLAAGELTPGGFVRDESARLALAVASELPPGFPTRVRTIRARDESLALVLGTGTEVLLGEAKALPLKLAIAARILRSLPQEERAGLGYLDVTVPERPVAGDESQLSG